MPSPISVNLPDDLLYSMDLTVLKLKATRHPEAVAAGGKWGRSALIRMALRHFIGDAWEDGAALPTPPPAATQAPMEASAPVDDWTDPVVYYLDHHRGPVTVAQVLEGALGIEQPERRDEMRMGAILRGLGRTRKRRRMVDGKRFWLYL